MRPVGSDPLGFWVDPEVAFLALAGDGDVVWLDAGPDARAGRSYLAIGGEAFEVLPAVAPQAADRVFEALARPAELGWFGWFGYELGAELVGSPHHRSTLPDAAFLAPSLLLSFDHASHELRVEEQASRGEEYAKRAPRNPPDAHPVETLRALASTPAAPPPEASGPTFLASPTATRADYESRIRAALARIAAGDAYQLCLTDEFVIEAGHASGLDAVESYRRLRRANPSPRGAFLRIGETVLLSSSPETFLRVTAAGTVETRPIKGTLPRADDPVADADAAARLAADPKERAENVMIVDLMRNDLATVAVPGSVTVPELFQVEHYATVHQLVSTVRAQLAPGRTVLDAVRACLPAGSMTGAPKHSAMTILDELEGRPRGPYAGANGVLWPDGSAELAMTIRTLVVGPEHTTIGTGGGITALSDPTREYDELLLKAAPLLRAAGARIGPT